MVRGKYGIFEGEKEKEKNYMNCGHIEYGKREKTTE